LVLSIGTKESGFTAALTSRAFPLDCERPDQLVVVFELQLPQPEGNTSGGLRRRVILDLQGSPLLCSFKFANFIIANNRSLSLLRFTFLQKHGFPLKTGGSPSILVVKTWKYLLKIRVLGFVVFRCYLLCIFLELFWSGMFRCWR
jgi:hypothetical protein